MNPIRFNGTFKFPHISPSDKARVQALMQEQLDQYTNNKVEPGKSQASMIQWQNGDSFQIETTRPRSAFAFVRNSGDTDLLDQHIKTKLQAENHARQSAQQQEHANAAMEQRAVVPQPESIKFSYTR